MADYLCHIAESVNLLVIVHEISGVATNVVRAQVQYKSHFFTFATNTLALVQLFLVLVNVLEHAYSGRTMIMRRLLRFYSCIHIDAKNIARMSLQTFSGLKVLFLST